MQKEKKTPKFTIMLSVTEVFKTLILDAIVKPNILFNKIYRLSSTQCILFIKFSLTFKTYLCIERTQRKFLGRNKYELVTEHREQI